MSYGNSYIRADIKKLQSFGLSRDEIVETLAKKITARYPDIPEGRARRIVRKLIKGKETTMADWAKREE